MRHHKPYIAIVVAGLVTLGVVFLLAAQHLHSAATTTALDPLQDADPVAVVKSILVNGAEQAEVTQADMRVTRVTSEVLGGQTGMLLVPGDEIGTGPNAKVTLLFLDAAPEKDNEVLIDSNARMRVGSIFNLLGRVLVRSKGRFQASTQRVKLDEAGTEYELVVQPDGTNRIRVLDGTLNVQQGSFFPSTTRGDSRPIDGSIMADDGAEFLLSSFNPQTPPSLRRRVRPRPQASPSVTQGSTLAQELQQVILAPDGTLNKNTASSSEIDETLNWSNEVIVAAQPTYSAESIIPHLQSWQERAARFRTARRGAILNNDPDSNEALGRIYVDWGNGAKAVDELRKALLVSQTPERMTSLGEAYRLTGDLQRAQGVLRRTVNQYRQYGPALNALGNVYFDRAKVAQDQKDYESARTHLRIARSHYDRVKASSTGSLVLESNIA